MIPAKYWSPTKKLMVLGAMAGGKLVEDTATGNPLTFITDVSKPLKSLLIPFTPQQEGTGDPSPQNIRPILPWNGLTVFGGGKNLLDITKTDKVNPGASGSTITIANGAISIDAVASSARSYVKFSQEFEPGTYTIQAKNTGAVSIPRLICNVEFPGSSYSSYYEAYALSLNAGTKSLTFTLAEKAKIGIVLNNVTGESGNPGSLYDIQLEAGNTATAYEPYKPITDTDIVFPSPVYGGEHEAVSGKLMNGWKVETLDDSDAWTENENFFAYSGHDIADRKTGESYGFYCTAFPAVQKSTGTSYIRWGGTTAFNLLIAKNGSSLTLAELKELSASGDLAICYELATPTEQTLTGHQITALIGNNTIWSDADGSMTAVYLKKG